MDKPKLNIIKQSTGNNKALIFINGFRSGEWENDETLTRVLQDAGWNQSIYHFWWDSGDNPSSILWWKKFKRRANKVGSYYLPIIIASEVIENNVSLLGYSLGARVAYHALKDWTRRCTMQDVILLGGAIGRDSKVNWPDVASTLAGKLINVYNGDDPVLEVYKRTSTHSPCGRKPIEYQHHKIVNEDATEFVGNSHSLSKYLNFLPKITSKGVWQL
jgi:hypothetical protein